MRRNLMLRGELRAECEESGPAMVASLGMFPAPAMEMAPSQERQAQVERQPVILAVGRNAAHCVDSAMEQAFAAACPDLVGSFVACRDRDGIELMMTGRVDMALLGGSLSTREQHAGMRQTRLGVELFALAVAADFPTHSLTRSQVRQVFTGEITDWQQLGYDRGPVVAVVPADQELANRAAHALILGDNFTASAIRVASGRHVADQILRNRGAIGVVRVTGAMEAGQKLLQIDWTPPTAEAFGYGTYPYGMPLHLVTSGQPNETALRFLEFAKSEDGRELLGRTLLVP
ncbi:MAG: substrate-binding domain-containing protein [Planctomycetota bacterium]|nr:substrate-binding domain-containing protein [Planctomycetota bacterium]